ncbi:MAG: phenylalanine--tRNA ligase subunit alpha [Miltoncostaeaceae bacterium]
MAEDEELDSIVRVALGDVEEASALDELERARVLHTGRRSRLAQILSSIGQLPPERRGQVGKAANAARVAVEGALDARREELESDLLGAELANDRSDITLPGDTHPQGALHLVHQIRVEIEDIFLALGYEIADGPEVETGYHNFTALNMPEGHPARSLTDTFFVDGHPDVALRSQTSPVQIRVMQHRDPPLHIIAPGAVYRRDDVDATHSPMFHQLEGLAVDRDLTMAHLKGTLLHLVRELIGDHEVRLHPDFFPFTEPSVQVQVRWVDRHGTARWLELLGAGMVDPNVLRACDVDSERWRGFAFGVGLDRIAMVRHGVPDLRLLFEGDLRFLEQFA